MYWTMRRLLVISPYVPLPAAGGGGTSYYYYLQALARCFEVDLVCQSERADTAREELAELKQYCHHLELVRIRRQEAYRNCVAALLTGGSLRVAYARSPLMRYAVRKLARERNYSCVIASHERTAQYLHGLPVPVKILDLHDVVSFRHRLLLECSHNPASWLVNLVEFLRMRQLESAEAGRYTQVWACTPDETGKLRRLTSRGDVRVARKGIRVNDFRVVPRRVEYPLLVFTGVMSYGPNEDGARFLLDEVWPLIRARVPEAKCRFVGAKPPAWLSARADKESGVEVTGRVDSVVPHLRSAALFLCPLRVGTGVRMKLLEAMAAECPVVTTTSGYRGIEAEPGRHFLVADTPQEFAVAVVELLRNQARAEAMARQAYEFVCARYDIQVIAAEIVSLVEEAIDKTQR